MPKRSNSFQKLILRIYREMQKANGSVTESEMVKERGSNVEREIDILLQQKIFGAVVNIAVECRGRKHKDDIQWIDGLIGKYRDLPIDKIVAVSKSGFTPAALEKAAANRIIALTLGRAMEMDWPAQFITISPVKTLRRDMPKRIRLATSPVLAIPPDPNASIYSESGEVIGTVESIAQQFFDARRDELSRYYDQLFGPRTKRAEDLAIEPMIAVIEAAPDRKMFIDHESGRRLPVNEIAVEVLSTFSWEPINVESYVLGDAGVAVAEFGTDQGRFSVLAVQTIEDKHIVKLRVEQIPE